MKSFLRLFLLGVCLVQMLAIAACSSGTSEEYFDAFFYTRDIIWDNEAGKYKVQGEFVSDGRPFTVGTLQDDCGAFDGIGCGACSNKDDNPSSLFEAGEYIIEVVDTDDNSVVSTMTFTVTAADYGDCSGIEVQLH